MSKKSETKEEENNGKEAVDQEEEQKRKGDEEAKKALEEIPPEKLLFCMDTVPGWAKELIQKQIEDHPEVHKKVEEYKRQRVHKMLVNLVTSNPPTYRGEAM